MASPLSIYYWPLPWRGNFLKLIAAEAGLAYDAPGVAEVSRIKGLPPEEQPLPMLAPPWITTADGFTINQMPAAAQYLARANGLDGETPELSAIALKVTMDLNDVLMEVTRNNGNQMWDDESWQQFYSGGRLDRWLSVIELTGKKYGLGSKEFFLGDKLTYADLVVFHVLWMFTDLMGLGKKVQEVTPLLAAHCAKIGQRDAVARVIAETRAASGDTFCSGFIEKSIRGMTGLGPKE